MQNSGGKLSQCGLALGGKISFDRQIIFSPLFSANLSDSLLTLILYLSPTNMDVETKRQELLALDKQKKALTDEAEAIISELTAEAPNGVSESFMLFFVTGSMVHAVLQSK